MLSHVQVIPVNSSVARGGAEVAVAPPEHLRKKSSPFKLLYLVCLVAPFLCARSPLTLEPGYATALMVYYARLKVIYTSYFNTYSNVLQDFSDCIYDLCLLIASINRNFVMCMYMKLFNKRNLMCIYTYYIISPVFVIARELIKVFRVKSHWLNFVAF